MAKYKTTYDRAGIPEYTTVWAYAFEETSTKGGMNLKQTPIKGKIIGRKFVPFRKGSETEFAMSKARDIYGRYYADMEAEAIEDYNALIDEQVAWYIEKAMELKNERICTDNERTSGTIADTKELKSIIVDLKMQLFAKSIPNGHCPYAYYNADTDTRNEPCEDCVDCKKRFMDKMKERIIKEVDAL